MGRRVGPCERVANDIHNTGGQAIGVACDVLDRAALESAAEEIAAALGPVDILVNAAGGNHPQATTNAGRSFFALEDQSVAMVLGMNFTKIETRMPPRFNRGMKGLPWHGLF